MTSDQVSFVHGAFTALDDNQKTVTAKYKLTFDDQSVYDSGTSFVFMVPSKEIAVCVRSNSDHYTDVQAPFEVSAASYDKILHMEGLTDLEHLMDIVDAISDGTLSDFQKQCIEKFANSINNANPAPMEDRPYYKTDPTIPGKVNMPRVRPDLKEGDTVYDQGGFDNL